MDAEMTILVKICGLTNAVDAEVALEAGADLLGFVFVPGTARCLAVERSGWIAGLAGAETVGVFRDAPLETILEIRDRLRLDRVQLHGGEPAHYLDRLGPRTIRSLRPDARDTWARVSELHHRCLPLLDPGGGDGAAWRWGDIGAPPDGLRFGLAGGLTPESVGEAVHRLRPTLVDVSSGVEREKGLKDPDKVVAFVRNARADV